MIDPVTDEPEKTTEEIQKEVLEHNPSSVDHIIQADKEAEVEVKREEPIVKVDPVVPVVDKSAEAISQINQTLAKQTELLNTLATKVDAKAAEKEWTLEQLRDAELKVYSGEYEQKWLPLINEKRATIIAKQLVDSKAQEFTNNAQVNDFNTQWNKGVADAEAIFGKDVMDQQSALFKTAQNILMKDPTWVKYQKTQDVSVLDPALQFKCFEIAHSRLVRAEKDAPKVPGKGTSKVALGGATLPKPDTERSQKLEEVATNDPNNRSAWMALMKADIAKRRGQ